MKKTKTLRTLLIVSLLALCLMSLCSAAVSVEDVTSQVGPQVTLKATGSEAESYRWYTCDDAEGTNSVIIEGATSSVYTTNYLDVAGKTYYKVVAGDESDVATVTATMPTEPVVLMCNNEADLAKWSISGSGRAIANIDGKDVFTYVPASDGITNFTASVDDIYLQGYPYVVIKASYPDYTWNSIQVYINSDRFEPNQYNITAGFSMDSGVPCNQGFATIVLDVLNNKYECYVDGVIKNSGNVSADGGSAWKGMLRDQKLRVDFSNNNTGMPCYIEYVGFFPTKDMALNYAGEMPHDDDAASIFAALEEEGALSMPYGTASDKATVEAYAQELVETLTADIIDGIDATTVLTFNGGEYKPSDVSTEEGEYTFCVKLVVGDKTFRRTIVEKEFTMTLAAKPQTDVFLPDVSVGIGEGVTLTAELKDGVIAETYKWYTCTDTEGTNPVEIVGADGASYTVAGSETVGTSYYKVVVNGDEALSCVAVVTVGYPTEPVVFKFNSDKDLQYFSATGKEIVNIDGKTALKFDGASPTPNYDGMLTLAANYVNDFYVQAYPYIVVSASYPQHDYNNLDVYMGTDIYDTSTTYGFSTAYTGIATACKSGFTKTIVDTTKLTPASGFDKPYKGKLTALRFDITNGEYNVGKPVYVEYIGFFPTLEVAQAYAGEMPDDDAAQPIIDAIEKAEVDGKFSIKFSQAEKEDIAAQTALTMINELTASAVEELKSDYSIVDFAIANAKYTRASPTGKGTYTLDAQVLVGNEPFKCSLISTSVTMNLEEKPAPVVMRFDSQEQVTAASVSGATFVTEGDRSFMSVSPGNGTSDVDLEYSKFYENTNKKFNFQDYPYVKMSYRRKVPANLTGVDGKAATEAITMYGPNYSSYYMIYPVSDYDNPYWEEMIIDLRDETTKQIAFYKDGAVAPVYGTFQKSPANSIWDQLKVTDNNPVRIRLSRYGTQNRTIDYEYIAFFASEDEAKMYPQALPENATYDVETLSKANTLTASEGVITQSQAQELVEEHLKTLVFATNYNIDTANARFTAPSSASTGTYAVDVWFGGERKEEYTVTVTVTMAKLPEPTIVYLDSYTVLDTITGDNAALTLEDGVIKMTVNNAENDDGFFLLTRFPGTADRFSATQLPYLKMRYKISGISQDANGNPVDPATVYAQFFFWMTDSTNPAIANAQIPCLGFRPYGGSFEDGDEIELIMDTSYVPATEKGKANGFWVRNITKGETEYTGYKFSSPRYEYDKEGCENVKRTPNTNYTQIRLNLAREANLPREAEVAYVAFFASFDEAKNFDSVTDTQRRFTEAEQALKNSNPQDIVINWGKVAMERTEIGDERATYKPDGSFDYAGVKTQTVTAANGLAAWVDSYLGVGAVADIKSYVAPTATTNGEYVFDVALESGYQRKVVENVRVGVGKKPDDYIMVRFNDPAIVSKLSVPTVNKTTVEDNLLKIDLTDPRHSSQFNVTVDIQKLGIAPFDLENYSFILMKHKRLGDTSPASFTFNTQEGTTGTVNYIGIGWYADEWYYTLYDASIRDNVTPWTFSYNLATNKLEELTSTPLYPHPAAPAFKGTAKSFTFNLGNRIFAKRGAEVEYIAFFPSMADARNYVQNMEALEDAISDTTVELKNYTADIVSYYDGNTQAIAEAKAKAIIEDKLSHKDATVAVITAGYTAPVLGETDGSYVFTAKVTLDGETVYTTDKITLTIGKDADNSAVVYRFTNPAFIETIKGAKAEYDYKSMKLTGNSFTLEVGADNPNVSEAYAVMALDATYTGSVTALINGTVTVNADADGYFDISTVTDAIDTVEFTFEDADAQIVALGFFADDTAADAYNFDAIPTALTDAKAAFNGSHSYAAADSKTLADAKAYTYGTYVPQKLSGTDVGFAQLTYSEYVASTATKGGSVDITVTLSYGDRTATYYTDVTYTAKLAVDPYEADEVETSKGHRFLGYDTITAQNDFSAVPQTLEFQMMAESSLLIGEMNILKNGPIVVKLVDGKLTVGSLVANTVLEADTWTHVAITADGKLYINGVLDKTGSAVAFSTTAPVIGEKYAGHLYDVRFWSDIRTEAEIKANMEARTDSDGLLANWMLNAASYKWLEYFDSSANENNATFKSTGWYKMEAGMQGDYSIIQFGDTQSYFAIAPRDYNRLPEMFKWMAENQQKYNIGYISLLGDATQNNTYFEWDVVREAHAHIDGVAPYSIPLGNHDYPSTSHGVGAEFRDSSMYRYAFPYDEYVSIHGENGVGNAKNTFGGTFRGEKDITNVYSLFTVGGVDYIILTLEFGPRDEVLDWAGEVLTKYPDRYAIIATHCYLNMDGTLTTASSSAQFADANEGQDIYDKIVTKYPNVAIVTCGHTQGPETKQHPHNRGSDYPDSPTANDFGGDAIQILADCSAYALNYPDGVTYAYGSDKANEAAFGADEGLIFMMLFEDDGKTMHTYVYSPLHDSFFRSVNEQTHTIKDIEAKPALNVVGTELREAGSNQNLGMRFKMTLSKSYKNFDDEIKVQGYGMVLVPADVVEEGIEVTADMFEGTELEDMVVVEECSDAMYYNDENRTDFTVVIHGIPETEAAYSRQIMARAYVDYTVNGGEVQRLYSYKTLTCSMNDLVNAD
ncbi:MAG: hypothetical protein E7588_02085 [Ruminococcaceae bacterium]|nr:hypothetical protein [Oscillospiraceae bacterium]